MSQVSTNDFKSGMKVEIDKEPYVLISCEFVRPGKGQAFARVKAKNLFSGRVLERTFKSGEKVDLADIEESKMRMLYREQEGVVFMDDKSFEQVEVPFSVLGENEKWLIEDLIYDMIFYKGSVIDVTPPTFMELTITETDPGARGDTASGRVLKPAVLETGAKIQIPIFVEQGEKIKVDTRTCEYVSRI